MRDFLGEEIKAGCMIVYPVRRGSAMWLEKLHVQQVVDGTEPRLSGFNESGRRINVTNIKNVIVCELNAR